MRKKILTFALASVILLLGVQTNVLAYVKSGYKLNGGITNRYYTVPSNATYTYNGTTEWYGSIIRDAVSRWNSSVDYVSILNPENLNFIETTDYSKSQEDYYVYEYGSTGWRGVTEFYSNGGTQLSETGVFPTQNWDWNKLKLNVSEIHFNSYNDKFGTTAHEFGHGMGLAHSDTDFSVMWSDWTQRQVVPTSDDVSGIRSIY